MGVCVVTQGTKGDCKNGNRRAELSWLQATCIVLDRDGNAQIIPWVWV